MSNVLCSYNFFNWDLGYSTGMNELLIPLIHVFKSEVDLFWCFKGLMDKVSTRFNYKQKGLLTSIVKLSKLFNQLDPWFYAQLARTESLHFLYCVRWIQVGCIGLFPLHEILLFWDALWTEYLTEDFILFFVFGILLQCREKILVHHGAEWPLDIIMQEVSLLANKLDLLKCLHVATELHTKFLEIHGSLDLEEEQLKKENSDLQKSEEK